MKIFIYGLFLIILTSCLTIKQSKQIRIIDNYFVNCMDKSLDSLHSNFYAYLLDCEDTLLKNGVLNKVSKGSYLQMFNQFLLGDNIDKFKVQIKPLTTNAMLSYGFYPLFLDCAVIDTSQVGETEYLCINMYKSVLNQNISEHREHFIDNLFVATDFNCKVMRLNLLYVFLLECEDKYNSGG